MPEPEARADLARLDNIEFSALRATVRERGSVRLWIATATFVGWGALVIASTATQVVPVFSLVGVLVLAAGFEVVFAVHVGVERIGRYLQVFYEEGGDEPRPRWETTAMAYGHAYPGSGPDPLFTGVFVLATALNYLLVALVGVAPELVGLGIAHALFPARILMARRFAARQRAEDLERFRALRNAERGMRNAES